MPESFTTLPDGTRLVVYETNKHPDISGTANIQEFLKADIPTYQISAENVSLTSGKNIVSVFNNLSSNRIRVQNVYAYARASANNSITLVMGYINAAPSGGQSATFTPFAADFPPNTGANVVLHQTGNTAPQPLSGLVFGGNRISLSTPNNYDIFNADRARNGSAVQLRPLQDGITVKQVDGGTTGTVNVHVIFTLD